MTYVTVVIAAWNAAETLDRAVSSSLAQERVSVEVIIVDDASTDETMRVAQHLAAQDSRVKYIRQPMNGGPGAARNAGFQMATGEWIAVLDADDAMTPTRLSIMTALAVQKGADAIYDNLAIVDVSAAEKPIRSYLDPGVFGEMEQWSIAYFVSKNQAEPKQPSLGYLKPLFRRDFADQHKIRYREQLRNGEDFHLMLDMLHCGANLWYVPDPMYLYTTGGESISSTLNLDHARNLIAATSDFIGESGNSLSVSVRVLMKRRERQLRNFASAEKMLRDIKSCRITSALGEVCRRPQALFRFCQQLSEALAKRLY